MNFFRAVVETVKDASTGLRTVVAIGSGVREITDRPMMQQRGFISIPKKGDQVLFLKDSGLVIAIASDSEDRPTGKEAESIVYSTKDCFIRVMPDGSVHVKANKIVFGDDDSMLPTSGVVTGECLDPVTGLPFPDISSIVFAKKVST